MVTSCRIRGCSSAWLFGILFSSFTLSSEYMVFFVSWVLCVHFSVALCYQTVEMWLQGVDCIGDAFQWLSCVFVWFCAVYSLLVVKTYFVPVKCARRSCTGLRCAFVGRSYMHVDGRMLFYCHSRSDHVRVLRCLLCPGILLTWLVLVPLWLESWPLRCVWF